MNTLYADSPFKKRSVALGSLLFLSSFKKLYECYPRKCLKLFELQYWNTIHAVFLKIHCCWRYNRDITSRSHLTITIYTPHSKPRKTLFRLSGIRPTVTPATLPGAQINSLFFKQSEALDIPSNVTQDSRLPGVSFKVLGDGPEGGRR